ncbi:MAG: hypothetical protein AAGH15_13130, partial [Myxococcota bacterium]
MPRAITCLFLTGAAACSDGVPAEDARDSGPDATLSVDGGRADDAGMDGGRDAGGAVDDAGGDLAVDAGCPPVGAGSPVSAAGECPGGPSVPSAAGLSLPCCFRESNASRRSAIELRVTSLRLLSPSSIALATTPLVTGLLQQAVDQERLNWVVQLTGACGAVDLRTGAGLRQPSDAFAFAAGSAPTFDGASNPLLRDPDRWDPVDATGTLMAETLDSALVPAVVIPVFRADGERITEFPFRDVSFERWALFDRGTCVGARDTGVAGTGFASGGVVRGFLAIEDVLGIQVDNPPLVGPLCAVLNQSGDFRRECDPASRGTWGVLPDAECGAAGCTAGSCDPGTTCNAWRFAADISAAGVEVL